MAVWRGINAVRLRRVIIQRVVVKLHPIPVCHRINAARLRRVIIHRVVVHLRRRSSRVRAV